MGINGNKRLQENVFVIFSHFTKEDLVQHIWCNPIILKGLKLHSFSYDVPLCVSKTNYKTVMNFFLENIGTINRYLPPANEVWGKVIFLHLFVILFTGGGVVSQHALQVVSQHDLLRGMLSQHALQQGGCLVEPPPDGYCCGQYASYWNAFLSLCQTDVGYLYNGDSVWISSP